MSNLEQALADVFADLVLAVLLELAHAESDVVEHGHAVEKGRPLKEKAEAEPLPGQLLVAFDDETQRRLLAAAIPVGMEGGGQFIEIESNAMGLVGRGGGLDLAGPLGDQADQGKLAGVAQTI